MVKAALLAFAALTTFATAQAPATQSVPSASHGEPHYYGGWHGAFSKGQTCTLANVECFPGWFSDGWEICIEGFPSFPDFELRCDSGIVFDRLNSTGATRCNFFPGDEPGNDPDAVHVLRGLPPEGDRCDLYPTDREAVVYWRPAGCARDADRICLGAYAVAVDYLDSAGNWVRGAPQTKLSESAAVFYFFDPDNAEVLVKLLDACNLTGHRWLYSAPATDLAYRVTVYSPVDGVPHVWTTNAGSGAADTRFTSVWAITDTEAFRCSEEP